MHCYIQCSYHNLQDIEPFRNHILLHILLQCLYHWTENLKNCVCQGSTGRACVGGTAIKTSENLFYSHNLWQNYYRQDFTYGQLSSIFASDFTSLIFDIKMPFIRIKYRSIILNMESLSQSQIDESITFVLFS